MSAEQTTPETARKLRYGLRNEAGEWLAREEFFPAEISTTDAAKRRGWGHESSARRFLGRHRNYRRAGFKVCPID